MTQLDERVMAYVDGELDEAARVAFEREIAGDADLASRVARQQALRARLHKAFDRILDEPVPPRLEAAVRAAPATHEARVPATGRRTRLPAATGFAMAASLLIGVLLGPRVASWMNPAPQIVADGAGPVARGDLARALSERLTSESGAGDAERVGLSFRAKSGDYCRTFVLQSAVATAGLACRTDEAWRIVVLETNGEAAAAPGTLRQAGSDLPESVRLAVEARIEGEPLDARAEARARAQGWLGRKPPD